MRVASLRTGRDGSVVVVSADLRRAAAPPEGLLSLQQALDDWARWERPLADACAAFVPGADAATFELDHGALLAPLPRAYQWSEGSTFLAHMERCRHARGAALPDGHGVELIAYQGGSDIFLGPRDDVVLADPSWGLDVEPTVAVITDEIPAGTTAAQALDHVKLVVLANDWTLRNILPEEFSKSLGLYQCKPLRTFSPVAVSPAALGELWTGGRLHAEIRVSINDELIGRPNAGIDMAFGFGQIIEHLARTRSLGPGSIIGSGTVSNHDPRTGIGCLAERRAVQIAEGREDPAEYLVPGDSVRIDAVAADGRSLFGEMRQRIVAPRQRA